MYGAQFESIEVAGITLHGWIPCPMVAICGTKNELSSDLHAYLYSYQTMIKKGHASVPFEDWFFSIPGTRSHEANGLAMIAFGIDKDSCHQFYFIYVEKGVLNAHRLTETCFIVKKKVVTLKELHERRAQRARDDLEKALACKEELAKCTYDLSDKIQGSLLLNFL